RQMPSSVASMSADWSAATLRWLRSLSRSRRPASAEPSARARSEPRRTVIWTLSRFCWSAFAATSHSVIARAAATIPPVTPTSKPLTATNGASVIRPSFADHENASINPQTRKSPATAIDVTSWRRRRNVTARGSLETPPVGNHGAERVGDRRTRRRLHEIRHASGGLEAVLAGIDAEADDGRRVVAESVDDRAAERAAGLDDDGVEVGARRCRLGCHGLVA